MMLMASYGYAAEITDAVLTTYNINREPIDRVEVLPGQSGAISCFTRVADTQDETAVTICPWDNGEGLMLRMALPVKSPNWNTCPVKELLEASPGAW